MRGDYDNDDRRRSRSRSRDRHDNDGSISAYGGSASSGDLQMAKGPTPVSGLPPGLPSVMPGLMPPTQTGPVPTALSSILEAQQAAQDKINRELFVGNTPEGTSEMLLLQFLNGAMRRIKLVPENDSPILQCRVNAKFAFVECRSKEDANLVLNLSGIPFLGSNLKVSRPSKYTGPYVPSKTWQELTGQPITPGLLEGISGSAEEKIHRELFIGNTTPEMTEQMLKDFIGKAMEQVGLSTAPGNPITACRVSGKFAFVELRTKEEAANALNLNNIPYLGAMLRVGRPSKYTGPITPHGNWEDILAKYMSGELKLPSQGGEGAKAFIPKAEPSQDVAIPTTIPSSTIAPLVARTKVVELQNMLTSEDLQSDQDYEEILEDTKDECGQFGKLTNVIIPRTGPGATKIFLEYVSMDDAEKAVQGLAGRTFDGRKVTAVYFDEAKFAKGDYTD
eukprot:CAMPEP_0184858082 /NCGR_PEP_ID=MMETSP0580-20130426/3180_1 /TAXON_ID=1118495 /ORGANISM="Dactyliosolen fragilissimus" /LENGTH=448 /DNA_ID=CAMNT_0027354007 /DNA_START=14 /DNA_END=1360 /DNA_ORIENTATION=-